MNFPLGQTRTHLHSRHALITPDGHVPSVFPGAQGVRAFAHITPVLGARFAMSTLFFDNAASQFLLSPSRKEMAAYLQHGSLSLELNDKTHFLSCGDYFYIPPDTRARLKGTEHLAQLIVFEKSYESLPLVAPPQFLTGPSSQIPGIPFLGNPKASLQVLFPETLDFDLAMNIFTFQPGTPLPFVETHVMEHGLLMLSGQGIYRLEDQWYPVAAGDIIWMASYCPQWFVAMGDIPASYLYYKDIHRNFLS